MGDPNVWGIEIRVSAGKTSTPCPRPWSPSGARRATLTTVRTDLKACAQGGTPLPASTPTLTPDNVQVDLIVHFDVVGTSTRTTQRNGRTGRRRPGRVVQLYIPGEENKLEKAKVH